MADGEKKRKSGVSPVLLIILALAVVLVAIYFLKPDLLGLGPVATQPEPVSSPTVKPAAGGAGQDDAAEAQAAAESPADPFASFLVSFGRTNPFAPLAQLQRNATATKTAASVNNAASAQTDLANLSSKLSTLSQQAQATQNAGQTDAKRRDGFLLTGIVRYDGSAIAIIERENAKVPFIVGIGDALEKTGYRLRQIREDRVIIASAEKELVLVLGGEKS